MENKLFSIKDKVILITGGYGILGSQMAEYLASEGAKIVILGRSKEKGEALVYKIRSKGYEAMFLTSDVLNKENLEQNREDIINEYGKIDFKVIPYPKYKKVLRNGRKFIKFKNIFIILLIILISSAYFFLKLT